MYKERQRRKIDRVKVEERKRKRQKKIGYEETKIEKMCILFRE